MYKEASRLQIRFTTNTGTLTVEQMWQLPIEELDRIAVALETEYKESGKKSFVEKKSTKDKVLKLKFDIVLDILTTKVEEREAAQTSQEVKAHNQKIDAIIAKKENEELEGKSIKELEKLRKS